MVNLQWHDACNASRAFTSQEKAVGWPADMTPAQLAAMQRPYRLGDIAGRSAQRALLEALIAACEAAGEGGSLPSRRDVKTKHVQPSDRIPGRFTRAENWPAGCVIGDTPYAYTPDPYTVETVTYQITPAAFAAWLHAQGQGPSVYVLAWFKAKGVVWPLVSASEGDAAPAVLSLVHPGPAVPAPAQAPAGKVPQKSQAPEWTGEKLAEKRRTLQGRDATQQLSKITGLPAREITRREKACRDESPQGGGRTTRKTA